MPAPSQVFQFTRAVSECVPNNGMFSSVEMKVSGDDVVSKIYFYPDADSCHKRENVFYTIFLENRVVTNFAHEWCLKSFTHNVVVEASRVHSFCTQQKDCVRAMDEMTDREFWVGQQVFMGMLFPFVCENGAVRLKGWLPVREKGERVDVLLKSKD